ncbi:hypothetical protein QQF64_025860 [Cirrhinus molitorella]|uniref:Uncharacterized protein n=1 Tax=Cirrhinus molitorella TaxID=172907 RepID=A0ABR3NQM7_9TELE
MVTATKAEAEIWREPGGATVEMRKLGAMVEPLGSLRSQRLEVEEQTDDVTYTDITVYRKNKAKKNKIHRDNEVIYASIRGAEAGAQENCSQLYASVNKNHHKTDK